MTVYIVVEHDYEDDNIIAVYAKEEDAEAEAEAWHDATVEKHEVIE